MPWAPCPAEQSRGFCKRSHAVNLTETKCAGLGKIFSRIDDNMDTNDLTKNLLTTWQPCDDDCWLVLDSMSEKDLVNDIKFWSLSSYDQNLFTERWHDDMGYSVSSKHGSGTRNELRFLRETFHFLHFPLCGWYTLFSTPYFMWPFWKPQNSWNNL